MQRNIFLKNVKSSMTKRGFTLTRDEKLNILRSIRTIDAAINQKQQELDEMRSRTTSMSIDYTKDRIQVSRTSDRVADGAIAIIEMEQHINDMIDQYVDFKRAIMQCIDKLDDPMERVILNGRYIDRKTWRELADTFNPRITRQWLSKRKNDALDNLVLDDVIINDFTLHI